MANQLLVSKEFSFDMAHRILGIDGKFYDKSKCGSLHGHTMKVNISVMLTSSENLNNFGFVTDFSDFKPIKKWIDENLDHATIISHNDHQLIEFLKKSGDRFFTIPDGPASSEKIAEVIMKKSKEILETARVKVFEVTISESCTNKAILRNI